MESWWNDPDVVSLVTTQARILVDDGTEPFDALKEALRFWKRVERLGEHWFWRKRSDFKGDQWRFVRSDQSEMRPNRWMMTYVKGMDVNGYTVITSCTEYGCIRPEHLERKTSESRVMTRRGTSRRLSDEEVREIRALAKTGLTQFELADRFGVVQPTISNVINGKARFSEIS